MSIHFGSDANLHVNGVEIGVTDVAESAPVRPRRTDATECSFEFEVEWDYVTPDLDRLLFFFDGWHELSPRC